MKILLQLLFISTILSVCSNSLYSQYYPGGFAKSKIGVWLDAKDSATLTRTSGIITTWKDKANNLSATQSTSAKRPKLSYVNSMPIVEFDGAQGLDIADTSFIDPQTGYNLAQAVYVYANASDSVADFRCGTYSRNQSQGTPHIGIRYVGQDAKYEISVNRNNTGYYISNYPDFRGKWGLLDNYTPYDNQYCYFGYNAKVDVSSTTLTPGIAPNYTNSVTIGNRNNIYFNVHWGVSETVLSTTYLTSAGRKIIQMYLANKWNMIDTVPATLAALFTPTNTNFTNNLVAIGTEGGADSVSYTGSNNGLGFQNINGYTGFLRERGDYLAAADNGLTGTIGVGTGFTRWNRAWYIDKTDVNGYGGLVNIAFDFTTYGLAGSLDTANNNYYLLYNPANGYFNSGNNYVVPVVSGTQIAGTKQFAFLVEALNISDGYYTIVAAPKGTPTSNITLLASFSTPSISFTEKPTISKVFSGNTFNYVLIDSSTVNYAIAYYKIYVGINGAALTLVDSTASVKSYFAHYNLTNNASYTYAVSAVYAPGKEGPQSATQSGTPNNNPPTWLSKPQYAGSGKIAMVAYSPAAWLPLKFLFSSVSGGGNSTSYRTNNSYTDTNLVNGNTYSYKFKFIDTIQGVPTESAWSATESTLLADSAKGGFTYNLSYLDPTTIWAPYGIGPSNILPSTQDMSKVRFIKSAPAVGVHPRLYCNPEDSTEIRYRLKNTKSGIAAAKWIHAYTTLLQLGNANYNRTAYYAKDTLGYVFIANTGAYDIKSFYDSLALGDIGVKNNYANLWGGNTAKMAYIFAMEAMECWLYRGATDSVTNTSYTTRANKLANALTVWARKALADVANPLSYANRVNFGAAHIAYAYDFLHPQMSKLQQDTVRRAIIKMLPDSSDLHAFMTPSYTYTSNWATFGYEVIPNLVVEGETGYTAKDTGALRNWCRSTWNFLTYGIYDKTGNVYEGLGKDQINAPLLVALAKRGYSMLGHPSVISYGTKYLPSILQPFGFSSVGTDLLGGTGLNNFNTGTDDPATGSWKQNVLDPLGLKWAFPTDTAIDFVWKNYMQKFKSNMPYNATLSPTHYAYSVLYDNFGAEFNTRVPGLLFASDYFTTPFATQAQAALCNNKMYFDSLGGFAVMRSGFDSAATAVFFANRQDLGGHTYGNKNEFLLSALGRIWIPRPTSVSNAAFDNHAFTGASCGILVNGYGVSVDTGSFNSSARVPGKFVYYSNKSTMLSAAGDATKAYSYNWMGQFGGYQSENPNLNPPAIVQVTDNPNSFRYAPFYSFDNTSYYNSYIFTDIAFPPSMPYYKRYVQSPYANGVLKKVFRTISLVQAAKPYVVVADDVQRDANNNNYKWVCQVPSDLTVESTTVNLANANYQNDMVLKESGNRRLLIRVLNNTGAINAAVPAVIDSAVYSFTGMRRLVIESNSIDPQFKVLLFAYNTGEAIPVTTWNPDKSRVYVSHNGTVNTISFTLDSLGRTNIGLNDADTGISWTGAANTNWHNTANWSNGTIPSATDNVVIPSAGITNMPVVSAAMAYAKRLSVYSGATLRLDSALQLSGDITCDGTLTGNGTLKTTSTSTTPLASGKTWAVPVEFNNPSTNQNIPSGTYNNGLKVNGGVGNTTNALGNITVNNQLQVANGNTLNMGVYSMVGSIATVVGAGTVTTQCLANPSLPNGLTWSQTVTYNAASGNQYVAAGTYQNLKLLHVNVGTGKDTVLGNINIVDTLNLSARSTLDLGVALLGGTLNILTGSGNLATNNTASGGALPANKTWNGTVSYYSNSTQTVSVGSYNNLNLSSTGGGNRNLGTTNSTQTITITGNLVGPTGSTNPNLTTVNFNGNGQTIQGMTFYNLDLTGAYATIFTNTTITILNNFIPATITSAGGLGTFNFSGAATQTIPVFDYNSLTVNTNGVTQFPTGATIGASAVLTINAGSKLDVGSNALTDASNITTAGTGTLATANTSGLPIPSGKTWSFTVEFTNGSSVQTIPTGTYSNILLSASAGTDTASGNLTINGILTVSAGATIDLKSYTLSVGAAFANAGLGTIRTASKTSSSTIPSNATWTGTVVFYSSVGFYTIAPGNYNNLDLDGGTGVARNLDQGSGAGSGIFRVTGNIVSTTTSISSNRTTFILKGNNQTIPSGITWYNLKLDSATNFNFPTALSIGNQFTPGTSPANAPSTSTISFSIPGGGVSQNANQTIPSYNYNNLTISGARSTFNQILSGTIGVAGTLSLSASFTTGVFVTTGSVVNFNGITATQSIPSYTAGGFVYDGLTISNTFGNVTANGNVTVNNTLQIVTGSTLDMSTFVLAGTFNSVTTTGNAGTLKTKCATVTSATPISAGKTWSGTVMYYSTSAQTIVNGNYTNLDGTGAARTLDNIAPIGIAATFTPGSGTYTVSGSTVDFNGTGAQTVPACNYNNLMISGTRTTNNVTLSGTINISGNYIRSASFTTGTLVNTGSTLVFNGTTDQAITATGGAQFNNLTINNTKSGGGVITLNNDVTVATAITLTNGKIALGTNNLYLNTGVASATSANNNSYVITNGTGNLIRKALGNTAKVFPVGTATSYAPLTITNTSGTTDVWVSAGNTITNAVADATKIVNLQWSVMGSASSTSTIVYQFNTADMASSFAVGSACELGVYGAFYAPVSIGTPSGNPYTLTKTGLTIPSLSNTNLYVIGNTNAIGTACTTGTWIGANGADANVGANWCGGGVPNAATNVVISAAAPQLTANLTVNNLTLLSGIDLNGFTLTVNGTISGTGTMKGNSSSNVRLLGTGTLYFDQTTPGLTNTLNNLTINASGTAIIGNALTLTGFLSIPSGTLDLGNSNITFQSGTIANTGQLGLVAGNIVYSGTGRFVVERLLNSSRRGYRNISSGGVLTDGTIFDNWQEGGASPSGYGMPITGAKSNTPGFDAATGFDYTRTGNPSLWTYSNTDAFTPAANTKATQLLPFTGYFALVRGDRNYDLYSAAPNLAVASTTLRTTGKLVTGTVTLSTNANPVCSVGGNTVSSTFRLNNNTTPSGKNSADYGFSLIGNPYACAINWGSIHSRSNGVSYSNGHLSPYYWVWNQSVNGGLGAWITAHTSGQTNVNPGSGNAAGNGTSVTGSYNNQYIQPGQSFFIQNDNTNNNLVLEIQESDKYVTDNTNLKGVFDAAKPPTEINALRFNLIKYPYTDTAVLTDGSLVLLDATYRNAIDQNDAVKLENPTENIAINKAYGIRLSIESRPLFTVKDTVSIRLWKVQPNIPYQLWVDGSLYKGNNMQAYVLDKQTNTKTAIGTAGTYGTNFTPTADSSSYANRFQIVFDTLQTLPIVFTSITAQEVQNPQQPSNRISWQVASASGNGIERYLVERSNDGKTFGSIGSITATAATQMVFTDANLITISSNHYYRIAAVGSNGTSVAYSQVVHVQRSSQQAMLVGIYPNQISNNSCKVVLRNAPQGNYQLVLHNLLGEQLATTNLWHNGDNAAQVVRLGTTRLPAGMYSVQIWWEGKLGNRQLVRGE